jgi:hypothetical protein
MRWCAPACSLFMPLAAAKEPPGRASGCMTGRRGQPLAVSRSPGGRSPAPHRRSQRKTAHEPAQAIPSKSRALPCNALTASPAAMRRVRSRSSRARCATCLCRRRSQRTRTDEQTAGA